MAKNEIMFHNEAGIRVQAQLFSGRTLISSCVVDPGRRHVLASGPLKYDIFLKNGATGWEIARKLASEATTVILRQDKGRYVITGS